jgi:hypothetical protein
MDTDILEGGKENPYVVRKRMLEVERKRYIRER